MTQAEEAITPANSEEMIIIESLGFGRYTLQTKNRPESEVIARSRGLIRKVRSPSAEACTSAKTQAQQTL